MLKLFLSRTDDGRGAYLALPASPADMGSVSVMLDAISEDVAATKIRSAVSNVPNISRHLKSANIYNALQLELLGQIAVRLDKLSPIDAEKCAGALDILAPEFFDSICSVLDTLDCYNFFPDVSSEYELGSYLVESGEIEVPAHILPFLDFAAIGADYHANHRGCFTDRGYVVSAREEPQQKTGMEMNMQ